MQRSRKDHHLSRTNVTIGLWQPTRIAVWRVTLSLARATLFGLAPRRVYLAAKVSHGAGGLLPTPFHPSPGLGRSIGWYTFCCTCRHRNYDAFLLGSTIPCGVRTFLPAFRQGDDPADTLLFLY